MDVDGRDAEDIWTLGIGIFERLGGRGGWIPLGVWARAEKDIEDDMDWVGEKAREKESSQPESEGEVDIERQWFEGAGIWLGVFGRERIDAGVVSPGVFAREGGRYIDERARLDDWAVDAEDVTGDQGLEDAIELRETLRLYCISREGTGGVSSERR